VAVGRNLELNYLWGVFDTEWTQTVTAKLQRLAPDVLVVNSTAGMQAVPPTTSIPTVFIGVSEPVAQGFVASLARPGGNITGFSNLEPSLGPKWLDLLKEIAPRVTRVAFIYHPENAGNAILSRSAQTAAQKFAVDVIDAKVSELADIDAVIAMLGREPGGSLILPPDTYTAAYRKHIVELAARNRLPVVSGLRSFADEGGLLAYGVYIPDLFRQAAGYVDRILRGDKPAELPVQAPTKFETSVNLKTAKALGLPVPPGLLVAADEVIE
jgi:putative ABC transport system substrate-binding protein